MSNYLALIYSNLKQKKRMFALEFCMISVVGIALLGVLLVCFSFVREATKANGSFGNQQATFFGDIPNMSNSEMKKRGIDQLSRYNVSEMIFDNGREKVSLTVRSLENANGIFKDIVVEGDLPRNEAEVLLPGSFKYNTKSIWKIGDRIEISNEAEFSQSVTISGFYEYANTDTFFGAEAFMIENRTDCFQYTDVIYRNKLDIKNKTIKIANAYGVSYSINEAQLSMIENGDKTGLILYVLLAVVFIVICYSMIRSVVALRAPQTDKENAIMRSFGARKIQILKYEAMEMSLLSWLAMAAAIIVTIFLFYASIGLSGLSVDSINELLSNYLLTSSIVSIIIVWILSLASVLLQTRKSFRRSISATLLNSQNLKVKNKRGRSRKIKNPVIAYIVTSLGRNKWKTILSIVLFSSSILFFVFISMFNRDARHIYGGNGELIPPFDARLELIPSYSQQVPAEEILKRVKELNGVMEAKLYPIVIDRISNVDTSFCRAESRNLYSITDGVYDDIRIVVYTEEELNKLQPVIKSGSSDVSKGGCILVNYTNVVTSGSGVDYSKKSEVSKMGIGDSLKIVDFFSLNNFALKQIQLGTYDGKEVHNYLETLMKEECFMSMPIIGVVEDDLYEQSLLCPVIIISEEYYRSNISNDFEWASAIDIALKDEKKLSDIADDLKTLGCFRSMNYFDTSRSSMEASEFVIGLLYVVIILAALIGFIIVLCTIMIEWEISQKEYAILKSVGATTRKVRYVIMAEKAIICVASCVFGVTLGIVIERLLLAAIMKGTRMPLELPFEEIFLAIIAMLSVTVFSTAVQTGSLKKMNLSEVMNKSI